MEDMMDLNGKRIAIKLKPQINGYVLRYRGLVLRESTDFIQLRDEVDGKTYLINKTEIGLLGELE